MSSDTTTELGELYDADLHVMVDAAWGACKRVQEAVSDAAAGVLHGIAVLPIREELDRRARILLDARVELEMNGHMAMSSTDGRHGVFASCRCGWRGTVHETPDWVADYRDGRATLDDVAEGMRPALEAVEVDGRAHAEPLGGRWLDRETRAELWRDAPQEG